VSNLWRAKPTEELHLTIQQRSNLQKGLICPSIFIDA
jgi:hypothetical protein